QAVRALDRIRHPRGEKVTIRITPCGAPAEGSERHAAGKQLARLDRLRGIKAARGRPGASLSLRSVCARRRRSNRSWRRSGNSFADDAGTRTRTRRDRRTIPACETLRLAER